MAFLLGQWPRWYQKELLRKSEYIYPLIFLIYFISFLTLNIAFFTRSMAMLVSEGTPEKIMIYIPLNVPEIHLFPWSEYHFVLRQWPRWSRRELPRKLWIRLNQFRPKLDWWCMHMHVHTLMYSGVYIKKICLRMCICVFVCVSISFLEREEIDCMKEREGWRANDKGD